MQNGAHTNGRLVVLRHIIETSNTIIIIDKHIIIHITTQEMSCLMLVYLLIVGKGTL